MPYQPDNGGMQIDKAAARQALNRAHLRLMAAELAEVEAVAQARQAGATWAEIGEDVGGMAGPNAHRKYAKQLQETRVVEVKDDQS